MDLKKLIHKYSTSGPRYTSYPTAPQWTESVGVDQYKQKLASNFLGSEKTLGMYVHVPFCESLCYYCGCNIQITHDHGRARPYVSALAKEIQNVAEALGSKRSLSQVSWGGGTPTFLNTTEIELVFGATTKYFQVETDADVSIEIDPRVTTDEQLVTLRRLGFNRVSLGVQDFDKKVQEAVHRIQPPEMTEAMLKRCRELGFRGMNFDLIYGLPHQTVKTFEKTIQEVVRMRPDRIALYNYARLPQMLKHQNILESMPMPSADERVEIFTLALNTLSANGYSAIGMDHFALREDLLFKAIEEKRLYRNFMGYVVRKATDLLGIGTSAIGELGNAYFQNVKKASEYENSLSKSGFATWRGCLLSQDDIERKWIIQSLMCDFNLSFATYFETFKKEFSSAYAGELDLLRPFFDDGILILKQDSIQVTELGRLFIRNVAMVFDAYLKNAKPMQYSKTV